MYDCFNFPHPLGEIGAKLFINSESKRIMINSRSLKGIQYKFLVEWPQLGAAYRRAHELEKKQKELQRRLLNLKEQRNLLQKDQQQLEKGKLKPYQMKVVKIHDE